MHLMRSWALLQVTLLSGGLTILLVLDLDGTTGKTEEAGENHYIGEARYDMLVPRLSSFPFHSSVQVGANDVNPEAFTTVILRGGSFLISQSLEKAFLSG